MELNKQQVSEKLGARVRKLRLEKGFTIEKLALESDMQYVQLSRIEHGKINTTIYQVYKISNALGQPLSNLFNNISDKQNER